jgi:hypothetical protein
VEKSSRFLNLLIIPISSGKKDTLSRTQYNSVGFLPKWVT